MLYRNHVTLLSSLGPKNVFRKKTIENKTGVFLQKQGRGFFVHKKNRDNYVYGIYIQHTRDNYVYGIYIQHTRDNYVYGIYIQDMSYHQMCHNNFYMNTMERSSDETYHHRTLITRKSPNHIHT